MAKIEIRRILCPVDFSEFSRRALDHAAALACWYDARITVLYVFPDTPVMDVPPPVLEPAQRERLVAQLKAFSQHIPARDRLDHLVQEAPDIHEEILAQATAIDADLLVLGSHGRSRFERMLLGSTTEKVMRKARCPVMVVPPGAPDRAPDVAVQFRRILCAIDFSEASIRAFEYALTLAEEADAHITLLHAIEIPPELGEFPLAAGVTVEATRAAAEAKRLQHLRALIPDQAREYCTVETMVLEGSAYRGILSVAANQHADIIVMGVQGRGALELMVFGSNTARVARGAECPVLVVGQATNEVRSSRAHVA